MRNYTKEQLEYRNSLHKKYKPKAIPEAIPEAIPKNTHPRSFYMNNCIYWIKEFENGAISGDIAYEELKNLIRYTNEYLAEIDKTKKGLHF